MIFPPFPTVGSHVGQARRDIEASKLTVEYERRLSVFEGYADRLERRAESQFSPGEDGMCFSLSYS